MTTRSPRTFALTGLIVLLSGHGGPSSGGPTARRPDERCAPSGRLAAHQPSARDPCDRGATVPAGRVGGEASELKAFDNVIRGAEKIEGLFTFYRKGEKLYLELKPAQLDRDYLITITQASGIGMRGLYSGMPLQDYLFRFRRVNDELFFVQRNVWFRAQQERAISRSLSSAFTDSVLAAMKLESVHPERKTLLVDLAPLFMGDLPGLGDVLKRELGPGYAIDTSRTYYGRVGSFPLNSELETYYSFNTADPKYLATVPDARNLTLRVRYSLSALPEDDYRPRLADDRVGYFVTAYQDFSSDDHVSPFVRYINRWNLQKKDPDASVSKPRAPIVFWLENTIPLEYREAIRSGVLQWNVAFEKAGFANAIVVKQQPDDATWDAADVRYNTICWTSSADAAFAMGRPRVNPLTGEVLNANIVIDGNLARNAKHDYRAQVAHTLQIFDPPTPLQRLPLSNEGTSLLDYPGSGADNPGLSDRPGLELDGQACLAGPFMAQEARFAATALAVRDGAPTASEPSKSFLDQFWGNLVAHEVGHTLGLRHNFHGSTMLALRQLNNRTLVAEEGMYGSVMDYVPANIAPTRAEQGYYYSPRVGPYDVWAIQYGYTPVRAAGPRGELPALEELARRNTEPDLAYATDEDVFDLGGPRSIDPLAMKGDLSDDPIGFSEQRVALAKQLLGRLAVRGPGQGRSYADLRSDFEAIMATYLSVGTELSKWIGGQYLSRNHAGDPGERPPLRVVPAAKQREALSAIQHFILAESAFRLPARLLNRLAPSLWSDWGEHPTGPMDYPILELIEKIQWNAIASLYHPMRLRRILDSEVKVTSPRETVTLPELFTSLTNALWSEVFAVRPRSITASRRAIQRDQLDRMIAMVVKPDPEMPGDARALARSEIRRLQASIRRVLRSRPSGTQRFDAYTRAHLAAADSDITKALAAALQGR